MRVSKIYMYARENSHRGNSCFGKMAIVVIICGRNSEAKGHVGTFETAVEILVGPFKAI